MPCFSCKLSKFYNPDSGKMTVLIYVLISYHMFNWSVYGLLSLMYDYLTNFLAFSCVT